MSENENMIQMSYLKDKNGTKAEIVDAAARAAAKGNSEAINSLNEDIAAHDADIEKANNAVSSLETAVAGKANAICQTIPASTNHSGFNSVRDIEFIGSDDAFGNAMYADKINLFKGVNKTADQNQLNNAN